MVKWMVLGFLLVGFFLVGCRTNEATIEPPLPLKEVVLDGLKRPWSIAFLDENEALIAEKDGDLLRVNMQTQARTIIGGIPADRADSVFTKLSDATSLHYPRGIEAGLRLTFNEGLLQVLLDPQFAQNRWVYLSYVAETPEGTTTKVIRGQLEGNKLANVSTLLLASPFSDGSFHYGGAMTFGPDGKLYITVGDRLFSEALQPPVPIAQDVRDARGMIYRINPDGSIPADNPDFGPNAVPGAFAIGIRNVQGLTVHPTTGQLWFSEHGTIQGDELNVLVPRANYGWPLQTSGRYRAADYTPPALETGSLTPPRWYWRHTVAPAGITFYTGSEFPTWKNSLLVAGLSGGSLWRFQVDSDVMKSAEELFLDDRVRARNVAQSPSGALYLLTDEPNGRLMRIRNANAPAP